MREKNYNTGLRGVLFEQRHFARMGAAVWLYGWLVLRQTHQSGGVGWVLGGSPVSYREIEEETGFNRRTLERWMRTLRRHGYIETSSAPAGVKIRITKAKKFSQTVMSADRAAEPRGRAYTVRNPAQDATQASVANREQTLPHQDVAAPIRSSSVEEKKERTETAGAHRDLHRNIHRHFHSFSGNRKSPVERIPSQDRNLKPEQNLSPISELLHQKLEPRKGGLQSHHCTAVQVQASPQEKQDARNEQADGSKHLERPYTQRDFFAEALRRLDLLHADTKSAIPQELAAGTGAEEERR